MDWNISYPPALVLDTSTTRSIRLQGSHIESPGIQKFIYISIDSPIVATNPDLEQNGPLSRHTSSSIITGFQTPILHVQDV